MLVGRVIHRFGETHVQRRLLDVLLFLILPLGACIIHVVETDHDNIVNKVIHIMCVWPILWTAMALFASTGTSPPPQWVVEYFPFNQEAWNLHAGTPGVLVYIFFYCGEIILDL